MRDRLKGSRTAKRSGQATLGFAGRAVSLEVAYPSRNGASMKTGWVKIRRGLEDHALAGKISALELGLYVLIHLQSDWDTGVWIGSAEKIRISCPRGIDLRQAQRALQHLEEIGFIKRFRIGAQRGNYGVLINKFEPSFGALMAHRLNAEKSTDWKHPIYEPCAHVDTENHTEAAPIPEVRSKKENEKQPCASADFDLFWSLYPRKTCKQAAWKAWNRLHLSNGQSEQILACLRAWTNDPGWKRDGGRFIPYPATFLNQQRWKDRPSWDER